jgi:predicted transcriptional regulator
MSTNFIIEITDEQIGKLEAIAAQDGITPDVFVQRLFDASLDDYLELCKALAEADQDIAEGRTVPHEEVVARFEALWADRSKSEAA